MVQAPDGRSTHIDLGGSLVHGRWFLDLDVFHKGLARGRDETGWTHVSPDGRAAYPRRFSNVEPFYNGQARVERFDGGLEVIDASGQAIIELRPARISEFAALSNDMVGFWKTRTIAAAVTLGVIDALPCPELDAGPRYGLCEDAARRLLRALGELGLASHEDGMWRLTDRGEFLRSNHPHSLAGAAREYAGPMSRLWEGLPAALARNCGWSPSNIFAEVARDPTRAEDHHRMLRSYACRDYPGVPMVLGLRGGERLIDAGGGLGTLANLILDAFPSAQVTVLDRPEVVGQARREQPGRAGLRWYAGDLFGPWGLDADVVVLARVLHDWDDPAAEIILRRARESLPSGGRIFIVEMLLHDNDFGGALCDLHLLVVTGGRERNLAQYASLLKRTGFSLTSAHELKELPMVLEGVAL